MQVPCAITRARARRHRYALPPTACRWCDRRVAAVPVSVPVASGITLAGILQDVLATTVRGRRQLGSDIDGTGARSSRPIQSHCSPGTQDALAASSVTHGTERRERWRQPRKTAPEGCHLASVGA